MLAEGFHCDNLESVNELVQEIQQRIRQAIPKNESVEKELEELSYVRTSEKILESRETYFSRCTDKAHVFAAVLSEHRIPYNFVRVIKARNAHGHSFIEFELNEKIYTAFFGDDKAVIEEGNFEESFEHKFGGPFDLMAVFRGRDSLDAGFIDSKKRLKEIHEFLNQREFDSAMIQHIIKVLQDRRAQENE
ncbi:MAG TPA: hypothetical protein VJK05_01330 [archaeon]|nr:hypothetical protein [archaeon]